MIRLEFSGNDSLRTKTLAFDDRAYYRNRGYFHHDSTIIVSRWSFDSTFSIIKDRFHQFPTTLDQQEIDNAKKLPNIQTISKENVIKYLTDLSEVRKAIPIDDQKDTPLMMYYFSQSRMLALKLGYSPFFNDKDLDSMNLKYKDDTDFIRLLQSFGN